MNPVKKQAKPSPRGSVAKCLEIDDPLERDACIIQKLEQRIDDSVNRFGASLEETADDLKREFKANLKLEIDDKVVPLLKSADDNAIGAIRAYHGMVKNVQRIGLEVDTMLDDVKIVKRDVATKDDLASVVAAMVTRESARDLATKEDLKAFATKEDLKAFATKEDLDKRFDEIKDLLVKPAKKQ